MPPTSPDRIELTETQRRDLDRLVRAGRTEQRLALRAGIVLAAADGHPNARGGRTLLQGDEFPASAGSPRL